MALDPPLDIWIANFACKMVSRISFLGKRKHTPPCSSAELFFAEKHGVRRGKISVVDMVFLVFMGFLYPPPAWNVFHFVPRKVLQKILFRWWSGVLFLPCLPGFTPRDPGCDIVVV